MDQDIYEKVISNKDTIINWRNDNLGLEDCLRMCGEEDIEGKELEIWKFAYENATKWELFENKYGKPKIIKQISTLRPFSDVKVDPNIKTPEILKNGEISIEMLTKIANDEFGNENWKKIFRKVIYERCSNGIWSDGKKTTFEVITPLVEIDLFGQWEKDLLFGHMKIFIKTENDAPLPRYWRVDKDTINDFKVDYKPTFNKDNTQEAINESEHETLDGFITKFLEKNQKTEYKGSLIKELGSCYVNSLNDLLSLPANVWTSSLEKPLSTLFGPLKQEVDKYRKNKKNKKSFNERSEAELLADIHKVRRFLLYQADELEELSKLGYLNPDALNKGFDEQKNDKQFDGGPVLTEIQSSLEQFDKPVIQYVKPSHGMILWGPPGTGKTKLCEVICKKAGIELVVEPLSSSELNRSKVGETEQLLMSLFQRAERLPYLLCCIAIDEVDALTPKRNEKTGEHKVDVLCLLLSLIGGIKDVPNVFVIASTNRLNKMDEAFCRRLQTKFFVGRLPPNKRLEILLKISETKIKDKKIEQNKEKIQKLKKDGLKFEDCLNKCGVKNLEGEKLEMWKYAYDNALDWKLVEKKYGNPGIDFPGVLQIYTQQLTINFSGAAIESFRSRIVSYLYNKGSDRVTKFILTDISNQVARDFQIMLGSYSIPNLICDSNAGDFNLDEGKKYTGRILVDLTNDKKCSIQVEYLVDKLKLNREYLFDDITLSYQVIPLLLKMGIKEKVDFVQMFDTSMLLNNAAFDDNTVMETILEKKGEWEQYARSMAIFDVDSLIGVNENISDSSMGQSTSYSITNNRLWHQVVIQTANSKLESISGDAHKWFVLITKNSFISSQFKSLVSFPQSKAEKQKQEENSKTRTCINCDTSYQNAKNGLGDCNYHDGPLVDITERNRSNMVHIDRDVLLNVIMNSSSNDRTKDIQNYLYLCCFQQHNSPGCKKGEHSDEKDNKDFEKYLS